MSNKLQKISIITPNYNQQEYLEATITSVLDQNYPNLEYIIIDGGSTDSSIDIIKKYEKYLAYWVSEPDRGMYDAINKGFAKTTGSIMGWINSDDILLPRSLYNIQRVFSDVKKVDWITGKKGSIDLNGELVRVGEPKKFSFFSFLQKDFKWIQQESTFWRRTLWEKSGGRLATDLKLAGDFELWFRFFQYAKLYYVELPLGAWRRREGQLSVSQLDDYLKEVDSVISNYKMDTQTQKDFNKYKFYRLLFGIFSAVKFLKLDLIANKRKSLAGLNNIEINYSYTSQNFKIEPK